jgi:hypothetical protein
MEPGLKTRLVEGEDFYVEGATIVFTARYHLRRGFCCENGCRHCPYDTSPRVANNEEVKLVEEATE